MRPTSSFKIMSASSSPVLPTSAFADGPRLLADVGGTNARFALEVAAGHITLVEVLPCADYPSLSAALQAYLALPHIAAAGGQAVRHAVIAIANPSTAISSAENPWSFSIRAMPKSAVSRLWTWSTISGAGALPAAAVKRAKAPGGLGNGPSNTAIGLIGAGTGLACRA